MRGCWTAPRDYWFIGKARRRRQPSFVSVMLIILMFGVLLTSDVIVDVTASSSISSGVNDGGNKPTTWLREFINNFITDNFISAFCVLVCNIAILSVWMVYVYAYNQTALPLVARPGLRLA